MTQFASSACLLLTYCHYRVIMPSSYEKRRLRRLPAAKTPQTQASMRLLRLRWRRNNSPKHSRSRFGKRARSALSSESCRSTAHNHLPPTGNPGKPCNINDPTTSHASGVPKKGNRVAPHRTPASPGTHKSPGLSGTHRERQRNDHAESRTRHHLQSPAASRSPNARASRRTL